MLTATARQAHTGLSSLQKLTASLSEVLEIDQSIIQPGSYVIGDLGADVMLGHFERLPVVIARQFGWPIPMAKLPFRELTDLGLDDTTLEKLMQRCFPYLNPNFISMYGYTAAHRYFDHTVQDLENFTIWILTR